MTIKNNLTNNNNKNSVDPFEHSFIHKNKGKYDWFKIFFCGLTLLPIRFLLILLFGFLNYIFNQISICGLSFEDLQTKPLEGWRKYISEYSFKIFSRLTLFAMGFYWINVSGKKVSRIVAPIIVSNHSSWIEPILMESIQSVSPISKIENSNMLFFGTYLLASQSILVDREDKNNKEDAKNKIKSRSLSNLPWKQLLIYPEGTCTNGNGLLKFKQGAFLSGVPVQPVIVSFKRNKYFDASIPIGVSMAVSFFTCLLQFVNYVDVTYLPTYIPSEEEKKDPFLYAEGVRQKMAQTMNVPKTDYTFEDMITIKKSLERNITPSFLQIKYKLYLNKIKILLKKIKLFIYSLFKNRRERKRLNNSLTSRTTRTF